MSPPRLWNRNKDRKIPDDAVYIGRGSPYGNPFVIGEHGTRAEVIERFRREVLPKMNVEPLRGKDLICYCSPQNCHGEEIFKKLARTKGKK